MFLSHYQCDGSLQGSEKDKKKELAEKEERAKKVMLMHANYLLFIFLMIIAWATHFLHLCYGLWITLKSIKDHDCTRADTVFVAFNSSYPRSFLFLKRKFY